MSLVCEHFGNGPWILRVQGETDPSVASSTNIPVLKFADELHLHISVAKSSQMSLVCELFFWKRPSDPQGPRGNGVKRWRLFTETVLLWYETAAPRLSVQYRVGAPTR